MVRDDETMAPHERWARACDEQLRLEVVVYDGAARVVAPGSAMVVAGSDGEGRVLVYFEGWVHGAHQYEGLDARGRWEAGVLHAAGRAVCRYPTAAMCSLEASQLTHVGWFDVACAQVEVDDPDAVRSWLDR